MFEVMPGVQVRQEVQEMLVRQMLSPPGLRNTSRSEGPWGLRFLSMLFQRVDPGSCHLAGWSPHRCDHLDLWSWEAPFRGEARTWLPCVWIRWGLALTHGSACGCGITCPAPWLGTACQPVPPPSPRPVRTVTLTL